VRLLRDAHLPWDGRFPYDVLSEALRARGCAPVTPESTIAGIKDAFFDLMDARADPGDRAAWDQLRIPGHRLVVDFFLYPVAEEGESFGFLSSVQLPVDLPDFRELAVMDAEESGEPPCTGDVPPLDIGEVAVDLLELTGGTDE